MDDNCTWFCHAATVTASFHTMTRTWNNPLSQVIFRWLLCLTNHSTTVFQVLRKQFYSVNNCVLALMGSLKYKEATSLKWCNINVTWHSEHLGPHNSNTQNNSSYCILDTETFFMKWLGNRQAASKPQIRRDHQSSYSGSSQNLGRLRAVQHKYRINLNGVSS